MSSSIDTKKSSDWQILRFDSVDQCATEVRRIIDADQAGNLGTCGNWTPGQIMAHLAAWIEYAYDGFPVKPVPFFIRWILRLRLKKMLNEGMPRGVKIPGIKAGTVGMDEMSTPDAAHRLLVALERLASSEPTKFDSPAFGRMSHEDWTKLNLRHAELHLGYIRLNSDPESVA